MRQPDDSLPGLSTALLASARRDLLLAWKRPGDILNPLFFFAMVCALFPLAVGPSVEQLQFSGPGVLWVAALLAMLLSLNGLFLADFEDGSLEQLLLSPQPLVILALGKTAAHWLTTGLLLVIISCLSVHVCVSVSLCVCLSVVGLFLVSVCLSIVCLHVSVCVSLSVFCLSLSGYVSLVCLSVCVSQCFLCLSTCDCLSVSLSL